jgi:hypothetical protein
LRVALLPTGDTTHTADTRTTADAATTANGGSSTTRLFETLSQ